MSLDLSLTALLVETDDNALSGTSVSFLVQLFGDEVAEKSSGLLNVSINLNKQVLFDMSTYSAMPLTCSPLDATWFLSLPEVFEPEIQTVKI